VRGHRDQVRADLPAGFQDPDRRISLLDEGLRRDAVLAKPRATARYMEIEDQEARRAQAESYLKGLAATLESRGLRVKTLIRRGDPVTEILAAAREERADLIAMTTHGRTGPARVLLGSVAESVLRHADVPVFMLRQTEGEVARRYDEATARA
jgi:nucleotide-binding universal stress UspA family protein